MSKKVVIFKSFLLNSKKEMLKLSDAYLSIHSDIPRDKANKKSILKDSEFLSFVKNEEEAYRNIVFSYIENIMRGKTYKFTSFREKFFKEGLSYNSPNITIEEAKEYLNDDILEIYDKNGDLYIILYGGPKSKNIKFIVKEISGGEPMKVNLVKKWKTLIINN